MKAQKGQRDRAPKAANDPQRVHTDVGVLEFPRGSVCFITAGFHGEFTLPDAVRAVLIDQYAATTFPVNVVAMADGAQGSGRMLKPSLMATSRGF